MHGPVSQPSHTLSWHGFKNQHYFIIVIIGSIISVSSISAVTLCNFKIKYLYLLYPPYYAIILFDLLLGSLKVGIN